MADKIKGCAAVTESRQLADGVYSMWLDMPGIAQTARPGQFVSLYCADGSRLLPRPISICEIDEKQKKIRLVYRIAGKGTEEFSSLSKGDIIEVMGPLGNGFTLEGKKVLLIGGGIGIPPLLQLAKELSCERQVQIVVGYRDGSLFLKEELEYYGDVYVATEDGSAGTKGNVIDAVKAEKLEADMIFACGPVPMLRGIKAYAAEMGIRAQLSMEERMACGIGACLACVCKSAEEDGHSHVKNKRVCKDGPVFYAEDIDLD